MAPVKSPVFTRACPTLDRERRRLDVRFLLVQPARLRERGAGTRPVAALLQQLAQAEVSLGQSRLQPDRLAKFRERGILIAKLPQHRAEHVMRLVVGGPSRDGFSERFHRLGGPAGLPQHHAERKRRIRERLAQPGRTAECGFGAFEVVLLFQRHAKVVVSLGVARIPRDQIAQRFHGARQIASLHQRGRQIQACGVECGVRRDQRAERLRRRVAIAALQEGQPKRVARVA